jgi:arylsulfatase A-like enzyme
LAAVFALLATSTARAATLAKPNILYIMLDDAGYGDFSSTEHPNFVTTPEIDQLATEGLRFSQHYANAPVCSPTRAAVLTGKYPQEFGIRRVIPPESTRGLPTDVTSFPQLLSTQGYVSGFFGKWHLGELQPQHLPNAHGFDESAIYSRQGNISYIDPLMLENDTTPVQTTGHLTEIVTDYALSFIDDHQTESFLLFVWYLAPHFPYEPPTNWQQKWGYADNTNGNYAALISNADEQIGRIIDRLTSLGLTNTSVVVVTSDNGSSRSEMKSNGIYRGAKADLYEGGIRLPLIVRWPGIVPGGAVTETISASFDFLPSIADGLGFDISGMGVDGMSLADVFGDGQAMLRPTPLFWDTKDSTSSMMPVSGELNRYAVRDGNWKLVQQDNALNASPFLFDIANDPREEIDLSSTYPEVVARLERQYRSWRLQEGEIPFAIDSTHDNVVVNGDTYTFNDGYVVLEDDSRFNIDDADFSFQAKVTPTGLNEAKPQVIAQQLNSWRLFIRLTDTIRLAVQSADGQTTSVVTSSLKVQQGVEYDIAFTIYGWRDSNALVRLYVDGVLQDQDQSVLSVYPAENPITLGNSSFSNDPFYGIIDDPKFFSLCFRDAEVLDSDDDALRDSVDNCANDANPGQADFDDDAIGDLCDPDDDNDGLLDNVETSTGTYVSPTNTGTDPMDADTDGDGSGDGDEVLLGFDPNDWSSREPTYTRQSDFTARLLGRSGWTDFDSLVAGGLLSNTTVLVSGAHSTDVTFPQVSDVLSNPGAQLDLMVVEDLGDNPTTSNFQSLGTNDPGNYDTLSSGTEIAFTFPEPTQGFGLTVVSPDQRYSAILDQDIHLEVPGIGTAIMRVDDSEYIVTDEGIDYYAYFLGVWGADEETFTQATLRYDGSVTAGSFLFNIDDLISVPEPSGGLLITVGVLALLWMERRRGRAGAPGHTAPRGSQSNLERSKSRSPRGH